MRRFDRSAAQGRPRQRVIAAAVAFVLVTAACSGSDVAEPVVALTPLPATPVPRVTATPRPPTSAPVVEETAAAEVEVGAPSQRPADAERDGVPLGIANLSVADRVHITAEAMVRGERWVLSSFPASMRSFVAGLAAVPGTIDPAASELLLLDDEEVIVRAVPLGAPATWLAATDDAIYAGRLGDGGYPDTTVTKLDLTSEQVTRLRAPFAYVQQPGAAGQPDLGWKIVAPPSAAELHQAIVDASQPGADAESLVGLDDAIDTAIAADPSTWPTLASSISPCLVYPIVRHYDFGTHCVIETRDPESGESLVTIADTDIAGSLVGAGSLNASGPTFAAIVPAGDGTGSPSPLLFVDVDDPVMVLDTGIDGRTEGSEITHVSFFDAGFVTTTAVDLATTVAGYDSAFKPLADFVSPTDQARGYPPDPFVSYAAVSPDGSQIVTAERDWPASGAGLPGRRLVIVAADSRSGEVQQRVALDLETDEYVRWLDFDGRWAVVSFQKVTAAGDPMPIMIDLTTGYVYPLGVEQLPTVTIERGTSGD